MAIADVNASGRSESWRHSIAGVLEYLLAAYSERRKRRRQMAELMSLGSGALKDLGIDRSEISSVVDGAGRDLSRITR
jgi:uncharacterized protein YjiS (DUF1127 family)